MFSDEDLHVAFSDKSSAALLSGLSRFLKTQDIQKIKRGLYLFGDRLRRGKVDSFVIANRLYAPSYVSFESALSFHGLIPEAVYVTTSVCLQSKKKCFHTLLGSFTYDHLPGSPFFLGVEKYETEWGGLVANPLKALFDLVYQRGSDYQSAGDLEEDLRVDLQDLAKYLEAYSYPELTVLAQSYKNQRMVRFFHRLMRDLK